MEANSGVWLRITRTRVAPLTASPSWQRSIQCSRRKQRSVALVPILIGHHSGRYLVRLHRASRCAPGADPFAWAPPAQSSARSSRRSLHAVLSLNHTLPCGCSSVPGLSFRGTLPLAPAIFMLTLRARWLQCSSSCVAKATATQGRSCSPAGERVQGAVRNGNVFVDVAGGPPKQMLFMQLVMHTPWLSSSSTRRRSLPEESVS